MTQDNLPAPPPKPTLTKQRWPVQGLCYAYYGDPRSKVDSDQPSGIWERNCLVHVIPPWPMIDDDTNAPVHYFMIHKKCIASLNRVLLAIWYEYNHDLESLTKDKLNRFSGSFVFRNKRHGSTLSMHSYGCALDIAGNANPQGDHHGPMPMKAVVAFESEGWIWGGRWGGDTVDPMHFQAARVR